MLPLLTQIPRPDVLPVPAPIWLIKFLLLLTFVGHVVPMNFLFGGSILAALSHARGHQDPRHLELARKIGMSLPVVIAFTVTLGVAPLLFVQVLYGQFFYSSSILIARAWFAVIPLIIVGYYAAYWLRFRWDGLGGARTTIAWLIAIVFALVGFIYSNNLSLLLRPETWPELYARHAGGGQLNWADPTLYPRYLHMLLGALAVASVWTILIGARAHTTDAEWSRWTMARGARLFIGVTAVNLVVGGWFLFSLPRDVMLLFMGRSMLATVLLLGALVCVAVSAWLMWRASRVEQGRPLAYAGSGLLLVVIAMMVVIRQLVREAMLAPFFRAEQLEVAPQWDVFLMFAVTLVVGLGVVAWLISVVARAAPAKT
jgi:hypothetical protein